MKYFWTLIIATAALTLSACSNHKDENVQGSVKIQIPDTGGDNYRFQVVELFTVKNLKELSGLAAKFYIDPAVKEGKLRGRRPDFSYIRSGDVIIPRDSLSLQLATVYAHMEGLRELDIVAGAGEVNQWPRKVAVNANYNAPEGGRLLNNALYSGEIDAMVFVPYTQKELPIMVNPGVIAHEHFHSLFYKLVVLPLSEKFPELKKISSHNEETVAADVKEGRALEADNAEARSLYHSVLVRGINEGLADIWGWIYSGDTNFVHRSIPNEAIVRRIDLPLFKMSSKTQVINHIRLYAESKNTLGISYNLGNQYARAIKSLFDIQNRNTKLSAKKSRASLAPVVIETLLGLREKIQDLPDGELLPPSAVLEAFSDSLAAKSLLNAELCDELKRLISTDDGIEMNSCQKVNADQ